MSWIYLYCPHSILPSLLISCQSSVSEFTLLIRDHWAILKIPLLIIYEEITLGPKRKIASSISHTPLPKNNNNDVEWGGKRGGMNDEERIWRRVWIVQRAKREDKGAVATLWTGCPSEINRASLGVRVRPESVEEISLEILYWVREKVITHRLENRWKSSSRP